MDLLFLSFTEWLGFFLLYGFGFGWIASNGAC